MIDKTALRTELVAQLAEALAIAQAAHAAAVEGATSDEARPENDKDTRGLEQSYLARGQALRVAELEAAVKDTSAMALRVFTARERVALGALVIADEAEAQHRFFLAPHGGGSVLAGDVQVVTPSSPLGRALVGTREGDEIEVRLPGKLRSFVIAAIS